MTNINLWDQNPLGAFTAFVATKDFVLTSRRLYAQAPEPLAPESAAIYTFMFGKFAHWLASEGIVMSRVTQPDLVRFLAVKSDGNRLDLNSKIAYRYLRLLDRCYQHLGIMPNPAQHAIFDVLKSGQTAKDASMIALTEPQLDSFLAALPASTARQRSQFVGWKRRRDRAMQVVMLLAGLRVAEAVGLLIGEIGHQSDIDGNLEIFLTPIEKHETSYEHTTVLRQRGVAELLNWLSERAALKIPGPLVFPADMRGAALNKATVYRQVRATFERAGIAVSRSGGRTLRNTFAVQELRNGATKAELTEYLGLALESSTETYNDTLKANPNRAEDA